MDLNDETNFKEINFTLSSFKAGTKGQILTRMKRVHDRAAGIPIATLNDYGLEATDITSLNTAIVSYEKATGVKKSMTDASGNAGKQIKSNLTEMSKSFKKLDYLVFPLSLTNSSFVNQYRLAREVINRGKGHRTNHLSITGGTSVTSFGDHLEPGDSITITNYSDDIVKAGLATAENTAPVTDEIIIDRKGKLVLNIPKDAVLFVVKYFSVLNPNRNIEAKVTIMLSKRASRSKAAKVIITGIPKGN